MYTKRVKNFLKNLLFISILSINTFAVTELDFEFGYDKQVFGSERENKSTSSSYSGSLAFYFLSMTAIEFNYSQTEDRTTSQYDISDGVIILDSQFDNIRSTTYGVGIRQALASRNSFLIPTISIGWARQKFVDSSETTYTSVSSGQSIVIRDEEEVREADSVFASFGLKIRLTKRLSLKGSVNTVFEAFEFNQAKDQLSYRAGLSWIF